MRKLSNTSSLGATRAQALADMWTVFLTCLPWGVQESVIAPLGPWLGLGLLWSGLHLPFLCA